MLCAQIIEIPRVVLMSSPHNILLKIMFSLSTSRVPEFQFASLLCMGCSISHRSAENRSITWINWSMKPDECRESSGNATTWVYIYCKGLNSRQLVFIHCYLNNVFKENCVFKIWEVNRVLRPVLGKSL